MNERIQELADRIWAEEYWTNPNTDRLLPAQLNKFAELIVKECVRICEEGVKTQMTSQGAARRIINHFGVDL